MAIEFASPVTIAGPDGTVRVEDAKQAFDLLSAPAWPDRGREHEEAVETALKVIDGHRSAVDARDALVRAAQKADNLIEE